MCFGNDGETRETRESSETPHLLHERSVELAVTARHLMD
eukprot:SAG11_NODE_8144_length_1055_cov_1.073222_1_plen_38_part_10